MTPDFNLGDTKSLLDACKDKDLLRNQAAYVLATAYHETAHTMWPVEEAFYLGSKADAHRRSLSYWPYYGRGYVQLTWQANYARASEEIGVNLVAYPSKALDPAIAATVCVVGMSEGWFTGKRLSSYITLKRSDFTNARRIVNGLDDAALIAGYARAYDASLKAAGYGEEPPPPGPSSPEAKLARIAAILAEP